MKRIHAIGSLAVVMAAGPPQAWLDFVASHTYQELLPYPNSSRSACCVALPVLVFPAFFFLSHCAPVSGGGGLCDRRWHDTWAVMVFRDAGSIGLSGIVIEGPQAVAQQQPQQSSLHGSELERL